MSLQKTYPWKYYKRLIYTNLHFSMSQITEKTPAQNGWFILNKSSQNSGGGPLRGSKIMRMGPSRIGLVPLSEVPGGCLPFTAPEDAGSQEVSSHHTQSSLFMDPGVPRIPVWESVCKPPNLWHFLSWNGLRQWYKHNDLYAKCVSQDLCRKLHSTQISSGVKKKWYPPFHIILITFWTSLGAVIMLPQQELILC